MVGGLYSAAAGMAAQQQWLDALSNDVANVNTTGYKSVRIGFRDLVYGQQQGVDIGSGSAASSAGRSLQQGALQQSNDPLALAIEGPGYFQVRRSDGSLALTRNGEFHVDAKGSLVNASGERLMPPVTVPAGTSPEAVKIAADGTVTANKVPLGKITIVDVPAPAGLQAVGDNLSIPTAASGAPVAARGSLVRQNATEGSNVHLASAMSDIMQAQRGFQIQSKVIQTQDQLMEIANGLRH
jgi:flagellar basal-body rod protein FlgG